MIENPVLIEISRNAMRESFHRGAIAMVHADGSLIFGCGNTESLIYPRSAIKLMQHIPFVRFCVENGIELKDEEISLMCGSHNAEPDHLWVLQKFMERFRVSETELLCGAHYPTHEESALQLKCAQEKPRDIHNNCSGKHSAFLAYCQIKKWPSSDYLSELHPIQIEIKKTLSKLSEFPAEKMQVGIDGCSAPNFALPLQNLALCMAKLTDAASLDQSTANAVQMQFNAIRRQPFYIAGSQRYCSLLAQYLGDEVIGKVGAEGVYVLSFLNLKIGVAIKIDDGKMGPQYQVVQAICDALLGDKSKNIKELDTFRNKEIKNWKGKVTGETKVVLPQDFYASIL